MFHHTAGLEPRDRAELVVINIRTGAMMNVFVVLFNTMGSILLI